MNKPSNASPMPAAERVRLLSSIGIFAGFPPGLMDELAAAARCRVLETGEVVFQSGENSDEMYVVAAGTLGVSLKRSGRRLELTTLGPGEFFGEMALLTGEPRSATVTAATPSLVLEMDRATMARIFHRHPELMELLSRNLAVRKRANAFALHKAESERQAHPAPAAPEPDLPARLIDRMRALFRPAK